MKRPDRCPRCGGLGVRVTVEGDVMKMTLGELLAAPKQKIRCSDCEGTGNAAPVVSLSHLRLIQAAE